MLLPKDFISFMYIAMNITSVVVGVIYTYYHWSKGLFGKFTSLALFFISYGLLTFFAAANGLFPFFPWLARTGLLMIFILVPLIFLAVDRGLRKSHLRKIDLLHGLPAFLYVVNFLPFWIKPQQDKILMLDLQNFAKYDEGWIFPAYFLCIIACIVVLGYGIRIFQIMQLPSLEQTSPYRKRKVLIFCLYVLFLITPIMLSLTGHYSGEKRGAFNLIFILGNLIFFLVILSIPELIYGLANKNKIHQAPDILLPKSQKTDINDEYSPKAIVQKEEIIKSNLTEEEAYFVKKLNAYLDHEHPFLNVDFSQSTLAQGIDMPVYQLRKYLKDIYNNSFNEFINRKRIQFLVLQLKNKKEWRNYNMGSLATEIGFKSVNSLYLNFKKEMNTTPKEHIVQLEKSHSKA
jgi:AraC-like DNA-binding protein